MQYKKLFTIPFIALSLFSTACAVQSGNVVGKESVYPPVANFSFGIKIKPLSDMDYQAVITNKKTKKTAYTSFNLFIINVLNCIPQLSQIASMSSFSTLLPLPFTLSFS